MRAADFTTYINAVEDPASERKMDRFGAAGKRALGEIASAANVASAAVANVLRGGSGSAGLGTATNRSLSEQATQARNVARAHQEVARVAPQSVNATRAAGVAAGNAAREHQALARSLTATSTAINVVQGPLGPLAGRVGALSRALTTLTGVQVGVAGFATAAFAVARLGNNYAILEGRLRPYFTTQRQVNSAMGDIASIAHEARAGLEPVADLYLKLTQNAERYGFTQGRVARLTRLASQAATLSGGNEQSRAAGLYQFSQGIAANRLGGDELRSLLENLPQLASALSEGLGVSIGKLRELGAAGALTAEQVTSALERSASTIEARFAALPRSLTTAGTDFVNNLTLIVGQFDQAIGLSSGLASVIGAISGNLREILSLALGIGVAFAAIKLGRRAGSFVGDLADSARQTIQLERGMSAVATAVRAEAQAEAAAASRRAIQSAEALAQARSRRVAIEANIAAIAAERNATLPTIAGPLAGGPTRLNGAAYRAAIAEERRLKDQLRVATTLLAEAEALETAAKNANSIAARNNAIAQATQRRAAAAAAVTAGEGAAKTGFFAGALRLLGGATGVAGIAITGLTFGLVEYLTSQSNATSSTDRARQAMEDYAAIVDNTTGKVRQLTDAEAMRANQNAATQIQETRDSRSVLRRNIAAQLRASAPGLNRPNIYFRPEPASATPGSANYDPIYRQRLEADPTQRDALRRNDDINRLASMIESSAQGYEDARAEINRRRNTEPTFNRFIDRSAANRQEYYAQGDTLRRARGNEAILQGGQDPAFLERQRQRDAEEAARVDAQARSETRRAQRSSTAGDNARYETNLAEAYQRFGIPSPEDIQTVRDRIAALQRMPIPQGQERARAEAVNGLNQELERAITRNTQYRGVIEGAARATTRAETSERDLNRERADGRREQRDQVGDAKAALTTTLNADLLELENRRATMSTRDYTQERFRLLETYDREYDALEQRAGASQRGATALIQDAQRVYREYQRLDARRSEILGRYTDEPRPNVRAERDIRELTTAQERQGEGVYPRAQLAADVAQIRDGLQRPLREMTRDYERQREIQMLLLQGREAEAQALRQTYQLLDAGAKVTEATYQTLIRNAEAEARINDALESRQRITSLLTGSVDNARDELAKFLTDVQTNAPQAAGNLARNLFRNFQQIQIRQFVERITAGTDEKVRNLISGRNAVETASQTFAAQISTTSTDIVSLADASRTTAQIMVQAARDIQTGVSQSLTGQGGASAAATAAAGSNREAPFFGGGAGLSVEDRSGAYSADNPNTPQRERARAPDPLAIARAALPAATATAAAIVRDERFRIPFSLDRLSSGFGPRARPVAGASAYHAGIDLAMPLGTAVPAALSGKVIRSGQRGGYGNTVELDHGNGLVTLYGHLSRLNVTLGQVVRQGQSVGQVGSTGVSTGNHLHFGATRDGIAIDPRRLANARFGVSTGGGRAAAPDSDFVGDIAAVLAQIPPEQGGGSIDEVAAAAIASMRRRGIQSTAQALGAYETVNFARPERKVPADQRPPSARDTYNAIGESIGGNLDKTFGTKFFRGIGGAVGTAFQGAGTGQMASSFARALGIKQSGTGAAIGGALGALSGIPGGDIIGGLIGGTLGGLLKKPKTGSARVSVDSFGNASIGDGTGNNNQANRASVGAAKNVGATLTQLADALGVTLGDFAVSLGVSDGKYRVDTTGGGSVKKNNRTVIGFSDDEQAAIEYAIRDAISDGALAGISAAAQRILTSGKDLQIAIQKAVLIESIPKQLLQRTNPVRYAVEELNRQFTHTIQVLKEAGATGAQFAEAQQLYDLQRADAIKQASESMFGAIEDFLREMTSGQSSPLNRQTVYENAQAELGKFVSDISSGKVVDQQDLLDAAKNFQEASRGLYGSSAAFFSDFDYLFSLLSQAKANAVGLAGSVTPLPGSPFEGDASIDAIINSQNGTTDAINTQTEVLSQMLGELLGWWQGSGASYNNSAIGQLPSFGGNNNQIITGGDAF